MSRVIKVKCGDVLKIEATGLIKNEVGLLSKISKTTEIKIGNITGKVLVNEK